LNKDFKFIFNGLRVYIINYFGFNMVLEHNQFINKLKQKTSK